MCFVLARLVCRGQLDLFGLIVSFSRFSCGLWVGIDGLRLWIVSGVWAGFAFGSLLVGAVACTLHCVIKHTVGLALKVLCRFDNLVYWA